jgi:hypothetical protein
MSADRLELELRDALRGEAALAPVTLTVAELRERAGTNGRPGWRLTGFGWPRAPLGAAVVVLAIAIGLVAGPLRLSVAEPAATPSPSPTPSPTASLGSSAPSSAVSLGSSGSAVVVRVIDDRLDVLEWRLDGTWRTIATVPSLAAGMGTWAFDGYYDMAIADDGHLALPVARGPAGAQDTRLAILDLARPTAPPVLIDAGSPAFLADGTLVVLSAVQDQTIRRYAPPYTGTFEQTVVPTDVSIVGPTGNVTTPLSVLADQSGLLGLRARPAQSGTASRPEELDALAWDGSVRSADAAADPSLVTAADRLVDAVGRSSFVQDPHQAAGPAFVVQAPGGDAIVIASADVSTNAWRPGGRELVYVEAGVLKIWDGSSSRTIDTLPTPADGTFISGFTEHGVYVVFDGTTWHIPFGECLRCGGPGGHLSGQVVRVVP